MPLVGASETLRKNKYYQTCSKHTPKPRTGDNVRITGKPIIF